MGLSEIAKSRIFSDFYDKLDGVPSQASVPLPSKVEAIPGAKNEEPKKPKLKVKKEKVTHRPKREGEIRREGRKKMDEINSLRWLEHNERQAESPIIRLLANSFGLVAESLALRDLNDLQRVYELAKGKKKSDDPRELIPYIVGEAQKISSGMDRNFRVLKARWTLERL